MKARSRELLDRAIAATLAAVEIYNKPNFPYRTESFCILAMNGWELLLKAKWLRENNNKMRSLFVTEPRRRTDGSESKLTRVRRTRSGNPLTHGIEYLGRRLVEQKQLEQAAMDNMNALIEMRNSSVHFYNQSEISFAIRLQGIGAASLKNFVLAVRQWFSRDLGELNFYLMPLSFVGLPRRTEGFLLSNEERNFLAYLRGLEKETEAADSEYAVTINIDVTFTRSKEADTAKVRSTRDPGATEIRMTEEQIREQYPWDYRKLTEECKRRYQDFKCDQKYHSIRKPLAGDGKFSYTRRLDPENPKSSKKTFYNPNILQVIEKHYSKR